MQKTKVRRAWSLTQRAIGRINGALMIYKVRRKPIHSSDSGFASHMASTNHDVLRAFTPTQHEHLTERLCVGSLGTQSSISGDVSCKYPLTERCNNRLAALKRIGPQHRLYWVYIRLIIQSMDHEQANRTRQPS